MKVKTSLREFDGYVIYVEVASNEIELSILSKKN
jgi:hypothetical protein